MADVSSSRSPFVRVLAVLVIGAASCGDIRPTVTAPSAATNPPPPPASPSPNPTTGTVAGVEAHALGTQRGEWAFVLKDVPPPAGSGEAREVWAVPLAGGTPVLATSYAPFFSPINTVGAVSDVMSRQLSPDGRTLLVAASIASTPSEFGIVSVDLATGSVRRVARDPLYLDIEPAWSPDGLRFAFARVQGSDTRLGRELWIANADGSSPRVVVRAGAGMLYGFTPDGRWLCYSTVKYTCLELGTGTTAELGSTPLARIIPGLWRQGVPAFAGSFFDGSRYRVYAADAPAAPPRVIADVGCTEVRWRPQSDDLLCRTDSALTLIGQLGRSTRNLATKPVRAAEWRSSDEIVAIFADSLFAPNPPAPRPASSLAILGLNGAERVIFKPASSLAFGLENFALYDYH